ncbi:hypothetical protein D3C86_1919510 [compost metagenome]
MAGGAGTKRTLPSSPGSRWMKRRLAPIRFSIVRPTRTVRLPRATSPSWMSKSSAAAGCATMVRGAGAGALGALASMRASDSNGIKPFLQLLS